MSLAQGVALLIWKGIKVALGGGPWRAEIWEARRGWAPLSTKTWPVESSVRDTVSLSQREL